MSKINGSNGSRRRGRPPLCPGQPSPGVYVRFPLPAYDLLDKFARQRHCSIPDLIRHTPQALGAQQKEIQQLQACVDRLVNERSQAATPEESIRTWMRLLAAKAETESTEAAVLRFVERWPDDVHAPSLLRTLDGFREANLKSPGAYSDADLWLILNHSDQWREMKARLPKPVFEELPDGSREVQIQSQVRGPGDYGFAPDCPYCGELTFFMLRVLGPFSNLRGSLTHTGCRKFHFRLTVQFTERKEGPDAN